MIPLHSANIDKSDLSSVSECLKSSWVSTASFYLDRFEKALSDYTKSKYSLALNSGTSALHLALLSIGVNNDDEVIVPTITFIASVNVIAYTGASPIFMDCDDYMNIDIDKTINFLENNTFFKNGKTYNSKTKKIIKAIIVVHAFGNVSNFIKLKKKAKILNIKIIEDAAESLGSFISINKKKIHSGTIGDIGCLSFNGNKIITTGSGGAIITNNRKLFEKAKYLSMQAKNDQLLFIHNQVGYNYRMNGISASLGLSQLNRLDKILKLKFDIHKYYIKLFEKTNFEIIQNSDNSTSNNWLNIILIKDKYTVNKRDKFLKYLNLKKIQARPIWKLNHLQLPYKNFETFNIEKSEIYYKKCICLPSSPNLSKKELDYIYKTVIDYK